MTSPTPSPAVLEALRLAEEAKRLAIDVRYALTAQCTNPSAKNVHHCDTLDRELSRAIDRLATLVQPPEAPAAPAGSELAKSPAGLVPWPEVAAYAGGAESGGVAAWLKVRLGDGPEATEFIRKDLAAPVAVEVSRLVEALRALMHARDFHPATRAKEDVVRQCADILATMTSTPALQVPSEAARLVGGEAVLVPMETLSRWRKWCLGYEWPKGQDWDSHDVYLAIADEIRTKYEIAQAAPTDAPGEPDDLLTVAHVTTDGGGILTMLAASLGDLIDIVGDEPETYSISIATMKRAEFEALGEFDGF